MSTRDLAKPEDTQNSLLHLRDEILEREIFVTDPDVREILFKINSCLYDHYPPRRS